MLDTTITPPRCLRSGPYPRAHPAPTPRRPKTAHPNPPSDTMADTQTKDAVPVDKYSCVGPMYEAMGAMWSMNMIPKCKARTSPLE